jgi:hypothetical protein
VGIDRLVERGRVELAGANRLPDEALDLAGALGPGEVGDDPRDGRDAQPVVHARLGAIDGDRRAVHAQSAGDARRMVAGDGQGDRDRVTAQSSVSRRGAVTEERAGAGCELRGVQTATHGQPAVSDRIDPSVQVKQTLAPTHHEDLVAAEAELDQLRSGYDAPLALGEASHPTLGILGGHTPPRAPRVLAFTPPARSLGRSDGAGPSKVPRVRRGGGTRGTGRDLVQTAAAAS